MDEDLRTRNRRAVRKYRASAKGRAIRREYLVAYSQTDAYRAQNRANVKAWRLANPEAAVALNRANAANSRANHIVPFVQGGPNTPDNIQTMCNRCNSRKGIVQDRLSSAPGRQA